MAKTPAEKMRDYRKRLRENGGKELRITMSREEMTGLVKLQEQRWPVPGFEVSDIAKALISHSLKRIVRVYKQQIELMSLGASEELIAAYLENELARWEPIKAEEFLRQHGEQRND